VPCERCDGKGYVVIRKNVKGALITRKCPECSGGPYIEDGMYGYRYVSRERYYEWREERKKWRAEHPTGL
jgi:hypothetical protein